MKVSIGLTDKSRKEVAAALSIILADEMTLYVKTRKFHWNVAGQSFMELHKLFEDQYNQLEISIDEIAERIGKLGHNTMGTMQEFSSQTRLKEYPDSYPNQKEMLKELLKDHETVITSLREDVEKCDSIHHDAGTADFLTGLMEQHETITWVLRRYLA